MAPQRALLDAERRQNGAASVVSRVGRLEDDREPLARRLVDVAAVLHDLVEECAEIALDEPIELIELYLRAQPRVPRHIGEDNGHIELALVEHGSLRRLLDEVLDRLGDELRQIGLDAFEY